ncbi:adenylate/guanylate cyclase domain-containing protein [Methylocucumis oryzae]|uniref:Guanylate cyclase domain-containing protein n=1 Tax=Methylocucumis oryzae TaxID=1632867 RepID=A0A0F3ILU3_9GAMM|nr:adenylate/guanylate cyclase domain-containing protein [Methylocucumis oryzae]KJV07725.1 hypothetical protein VZ94_02690 [Methylocucumis oryzae]
MIEFRADGVMCAWTAESSCVEPRYNALLAGIEAVEAIAGFQKRYAQFSHSLRIGIEDGMAYVGHAGGGGHFVYSIVGDCANTAARIESLNKKLKTQLLVSASVLAGVGGLLCRFVGDFRFVGKTEPLSIYEVVASDEQASDAQIQLCQQFGAAMKVLSTGDWNKAGDMFAEILTEFPSDGPSRFHLERCRRCSAVPLVSDSPLVIHLDSK